MKAAVSGVIGQIAKRFGDDFYTKTTAALSGGIGASQAFFELGFGNYLKANFDRCDKVKTLLSRRQAISLSKLYVDAWLELEGDRHLEADIVSDPERKRVIITGTAGSGKSFLMKRTFLRFCETNHGVFPVFVELRHLNERSQASLWEMILELFAPHVTNYTPGVIEYLFGLGKIVLLLDGFDEIKAPLRETVEDQISDICYRYPGIKVIVSGRPDQGFTAWKAFDEFAVVPLDRDQCLSVVARTTYHVETKKKFKQAVEEKLWDSHQAYLENPLMISVMLMTFDKFIEIPNSMGEFYAKAFETLYTGHDKTKSTNFNRDVKCTVSLRELENVLSYFCALSYINADYDYDEESALVYLNDALKLCGADQSGAALLDDINKAYCLLVLDGVRYAYIHRSFQEYFTAICLSRSEIIDFEKFNTEIAQSFEFSRYMHLLREINKERFDRKFLIPLLERYLADVAVLRDEDPRRFVRVHVQEIGYDPEGSATYFRHSGPYRGVQWFNITNFFFASVEGTVSVLESYIAAEDVDLLQRISEDYLDESEGSDEEYIGVRAATYELSVDEVSLTKLRKSNLYRHLSALSEAAEKRLEELKRSYQEVVAQKSISRYKLFMKGADPLSEEK